MEQTYVFLHGWNNYNSECNFTVKKVCKYLVLYLSCRYAVSGVFTFWLLSAFLDGPPGANPKSKHKLLHR